MYDVIVAGGTLGVFVAVSLAQRGLRVAVVERGKLAGRTQEWNISRKELLELVEVRTQGEGVTSCAGSGVSAESC
jgi:pyruvate/2-oxoglutarate dehydrogenase complex dihydrolipoamide dehydrogenase (E3) component